VRAMVERLLHVRLGNCPDDVSDALAVAICHAHTRRGARR
jgi:Holliday junction resolvasome RuvABC endonuclease subunit